VERTAELARQAHVTQGRTLRLDATCVPTRIPHPKDLGLLVESGRVLSRLVQQAKVALVARGAPVRLRCRSRLSTAWRVAQRLHRGLRRKGEDKEAECDRRRGSSPWSRA